MAASVCWPSCDPVVLPINFALLTERNAAGKPLFLEVLKAGIIVGKLAVKIIDRVP
jgi:hypothetical protein